MSELTQAQRDYQRRLERFGGKEGWAEHQRKYRRNNPEITKRAKQNYYDKVKDKPETKKKRNGRYAENIERERETARKSYARRKDKLTGYASKRRWARYGLTVEEGQALIEKANGSCMICGKPHKSLNVDHCHETGKVRGMLCSNCNTGIGLFKDNTGLLQAAIDYLSGVKLIAPE